MPAQWTAKSLSIAPSPALAVGIVLVALLASASALAAATFTVTRPDDQLDTLPGDGACIAQNGGGCSLRAAVQEANALFGADGIYLPPGTYSLTRAGAGENLAATGDLDIASAITLVGTGWSVTTIEMTGYIDRIFDVQGFSSLTLADVTISGGAVAGIGGGILVEAGGTLTLARSRIRGCLSNLGGGLGVVGGTAIVEDSEIAHCFVFADLPTWYGEGPGVSIGEQGNVVIRRSSMHDNLTGSGTLGSIRSVESTLWIESSSIIDNDNGNPYIGGTNSDVTIISSTISSVSLDGWGPPTSSLTLGCSIVRHCYYTQGATYTSYGYNAFSGGAPCVGAFDVDNDWNLQPLMAPPGKFAARVPNKYSAAIDGGHAFVCTANDQWLQPRPLDGDGDGIAIVDVGAVEAALIFYDGFESNNTSAWSTPVP
ncbi:MAG: choice-of-anchor Q domain-containing protein [Thermoanaerobaculia bacterium]